MSQDKAGQPGNEGPAKRGGAVALRYDPTSASPRVVAKGYGVVAESIIAQAREAGIYVHDSPALLTLLMQIDLDSQIPPQLYLAVAELLAWLYAVEQEGVAPESLAGAI